MRDPETGSVEKRFSWLFWVSLWFSIVFLLMFKIWSHKKREDGRSVCPFSACFGLVLWWAFRGAFGVPVECDEGFLVLVCFVEFISGDVSYDGPCPDSQFYAICAFDFFRCLWNGAEI